MESIAAENSTSAQHLNGAAMMNVVIFDPRAATGGSAMARAIQLRGRTAWRRLYPQTAPPSAAPAEEQRMAQGDVGNDAGGVVAVVSPSSTAPVASPFAVDRKRYREGGGKDEIISVDPMKLKAKSALVVSRAAEDAVEEQRYAPPSKWKLMKVLVGHQGWVWAVAVEPSNQWMATGGFDGLIKIWDMATGALKLNLTGHKEAVRSIALSKLSPYMFSGSDDHSVKCWDLERNEVVREFFGHKSSVHCVAVHPTLDIVVSGGRDRTVRVFDIRSRAVVHTLTGHTDSVMSLLTQQEDPQVISGGSDGFIYLWDLAAGKAMARLTRHKKPVRGMTLTASGSTLVSCGADEVRVWKMPTGEFITNASTTLADSKKQKGSDEAEMAYRWSSCAMSPNNVLAVGSQDGELFFYDWNRPQPTRMEGQYYPPFQCTKTKSLPGTLPGEGGINSLVYDHSGTRLITAESDKTVKIWRMRN